MTITITLDPAGPPKRQIIEMAFGNIAITGYEFGHTPEEIADAMVRLDALMYEWPYSELGFSHPDYGTGNAEESSGIPFDCLNAVAAALALRLAPAFGKELPAATAANLVSALAVLRARVATIPTMPLGSNTPRGMGNRTSFGPFISETAEDVNAEET